MIAKATILADCRPSVDPVELLLRKIVGCLHLEYIYKDVIVERRLRTEQEVDLLKMERDSKEADNL